MLLKPYSVLEEYAEDNPYVKSHVGDVVDNNDPEHLDRLKVAIDLWDYMTTEELPWVTPSGGSVGNSTNTKSHDIPEVGSQVRITFYNFDPDSPRYEGMEITDDSKCSLFEEDYPNTHGTKDSIGNFVVHNKKTGISVFHHNSGTTTQFDKDGSFTIKGPNGAIASCNAQNEWYFSGSKAKFDMTDSIEFASSNILLKALTVVKVQSASTEIKADSGFNVSSGGPVSIAGSQVDIQSPKTTVSSILSVGNGGNAIISDLMGMAMYEFKDGIMTGGLSAK